MEVALYFVFWVMNFEIWIAQTDYATLVLTYFELSAKSLYGIQLLLEAFNLVTDETPTQPACMSRNALSERPCSRYQHALVCQDSDVYFHFF